MRRRDFLSVIAGATVWPLAARAQQPTTPVIGFFTFQPISTSQSLMDAFRLGTYRGRIYGGQNRSHRIPRCQLQARADATSCP